MKTLITTVALVAAMLAPSSAEARPVHTLRLCPADEITMVYCVWDAKHMGNGMGQSYKVRRDGTVKHLTHRKAHRLLAKHDWFYDHSSGCWFHVDRHPLRIKWFC